MADGEHNIRITSTADTSGVQQAEAAEQSLAQQIMANANRNAAAKQAEAAAVAAAEKTKADAKAKADAEAKKSEAQSRTFLEKLGDRLEQIPGAGLVKDLFTSGPAVASLGAITGALLAVNKGLEEYANRQAINTKLDQQLANSGRLTGEYRAQLHDLAEEFSKASAIDGGKWLEALGKIQGKGTSDDLAKNAAGLKNLAAATGDVDLAAVLLSRALAGKFSALSRYGFSIDENASKTEKLQQLMEQAAKRGAGVFEANLATLTGQKQRLSAATSNLFEGVGRLAYQMGFGSSTARALTTAIEWLNSKLPGTDEVVGGITNKFDNFSKAAEIAAGRSGSFSTAAGELGDDLDSTSTRAKSAAEEMQKFAESLDAATAAATRQADAQLADKLAQIDARAAALAAQQGGRLTPAQTLDFATQRIGARREAETRKTALEMGGAEAKKEEIERAEAAAAAALQTAQAKVAKTEAQQRTELGALGVPVNTADMASTTAELQKDVAGASEALAGYKKDLLAIREAESLVAGAGMAGVPRLVQLAEQRRYIEEAKAELEAVLKPFDEASRRMGDIAKENAAALKEEAEAADRATAAYRERQKIEAELQLLRTKAGTQTTTSATAQTEAATKAATDARAAEKARIDAAITANAKELETATGPRRDELGRAQAGLRARSFEIGIAGEADPLARGQLIGQAQQAGFTVGPGGRVTPTAARPGTPAVQTAASVAEATAAIATAAGVSVAQLQAILGALNAKTAAEQANQRAIAEKLRADAKKLQEINDLILYGQP